MTRKLLVVTSRSLDRRVSAELEANDWEIVPADGAASARRILHRQDVLVGLFVLWPDDQARHRKEIADMVTEADKIRWIGGLERTELGSESCLALVAEHLHDFVSLPLDPRRLAVIAGHAYGMADLDRQLLARQELPLAGDLGMLGTSDAMRDLYQDLRQAAASDAPVIVYGETGSGKETTARAIHAASSRASGPFIAIECAALDTSYLPSHPSDPMPRSLGLDELDGAFDEANEGGTLFLDDISDLSAAAQARLLSLVDKECRSRPERDDATPWEGARLRILCASDGELETTVRAGRFRSDLFFRLQVLSVQVPSLRERGEDIWMLARHFLQVFRERQMTRALGFSKDALAVLSLHDWPGNLRELRNRVHKAALSCREGYISPKQLGLERRTLRRGGVSLRNVREDAERQAIESAIKRNGSNLTRAAEELDVSRMTLYRMLEKHGLSVER
jgi:DNA-binding NtrC family response regulator